MICLACSPFLLGKSPKILASPSCQIYRLGPKRATEALKPGAQPVATVQGENVSLGVRNTGHLWCLWGIPNSWMVSNGLYYLILWINIKGFPTMGVPPNGWFLMVNFITMDIYG